MSEKKELKNEELDKVTGGEQTSPTIEGLTFVHELGARVKVYYNSHCYETTVAKQGYIFFGGEYKACVYLTADNNDFPNGWYCDTAGLDYRITDGLALQIVVLHE